MESDGRALPDPLFAPATGSAIPSTAICIAVPGAVVLGTCTMARMTVFPLAVTTQVGRQGCVPVEPDWAARLEGREPAGVAGGAGVPVGVAGGAGVAAGVAGVAGGAGVPVSAGPTVPGLCGLTGAIVARGLAGGVLGLGFGQLAVSVTPTGSVTVAIVTSSVLPAGSCIPIR